MKQQGLLAWAALLLMWCGRATSLMKRMREGADERGGDTWAAQQLQDVLASIDDRLRALDNFGYTMKLARLDFSLEQLVRRMEGVEAKLGRLELRREEKEEFSNEHLSRRVEGLSEKVSAKAAHLEVKLERMDAKLDLLDRDMHGSVDDLLERMVKGEERCESLNARRDEKLDGVRDRVREVLSLSGSLVDSVCQIANRSETALKDVQQVVAATGDRLMATMLDGQARIDDLEQRGRVGAPDNLTVVLDRALSRHEAKFRELETYTRKVVHGIQELWKTSDELRAELSQALEEGGRTHEVVREEFRRLHEQVAPLPALSEETARQVVELSATVDASFATLLVAQNAFIDSCSRVQQEETHVYGVLQQVVYEMRNRSVDDVRRIGAQLRTQGAEFNRSLARVVTALQLTGNRTLHQLQLQHVGCRPVEQNKSAEVLLYEDTEAMQDYEDYHLSDYPEST